MIKNTISHLGGVGLYGVLSICLFFLVFVVATLVAVLKKPAFVAHMSALPLENDSESASKVPSKGECLS